MYRRIVIGLNLLSVSVLCLTADEIEAERSGWSANPNTQYHVQTDEGPERYFRFQTLNGQYRKEKRLADGTVIGTEGWLDPLGYLRLKDYIADHEGFRILKSKMIFVGKDRPIGDAIAEAKKAPAQTGVLARPRRPPNPFRKPEANDVAPLANNDIGYYSSSTVKPHQPISYEPARGTNRYYYDPERRSYVWGPQPSTYPRAKNYYSPRTRPVQTLQSPLGPYDASTDDSSLQLNYRQPTTVSRGSSYDLPPYDGTHTTANGFQYYLQRHYHEEEREPGGENVGSFGYIDPFGIRRVIYYKTDPRTGGFLHRKNNRYVGFAATPYDPLPPKTSRRARTTSSANSSRTS